MLQTVKLNMAKRLWKFKILLKFWELFGFLAYLEPKFFSLLFHHEEPFISLIVSKPGQTHPKVEQEHNKWLPRPYDLHPSQENNLTATFIWPKAFISCSQHNRCSNLTEVEIVKPGCGRFDLLIEAESGIRGVISSWQLDWITHHRSDHKISSILWAFSDQGSMLNSVFFTNAHS